MNICVIFHNADHHNGATHSMLDLIKTWSESDLVNITCVFPCEGSAIGVLNQLGIHCIIQSFHGVRYNINDKFFIKPLRIMYRTMRMVYEKFALTKELASKLQNYNIDLVYSNTSSIYMGIWLSEYLDVPHAWHIRELGEEDQNARMLLGNKYLSKMLNKSSYIVMISECVYQKYIKYIKSKNSVHIYYNDVMIKSAPQYDRKISNKLNVLIVGSIIEGKGHEHVIYAIKSLNNQGVDTDLYIAGKAEGPYFQKMKRLARELQIEGNIRFLGHVSCMDDVMKDMHIQVVASRCEAFGRITIEAMLAGLPIIGADTGCTLELINKNKYGLLYKWGNCDDLASKIMDAYKNYGEMIEKAKCANTFAVQFTKGETAKKITRDLVLIK